MAFFRTDRDLHVNQLLTVRVFGSTLSETRITMECTNTWPKREEVVNNVGRKPSGFGWPRTLFFLRSVGVVHFLAVLCYARSWVFICEQQWNFCVWPLLVES